MPESVADSGIFLYNGVMGVRNMANETDKALDKKTLILAEAERIFAEKGYYGLGLSELLKSCDVPKGSFYYYFPGGQKQLLQEALEFSYRRMERGINGVKLKYEECETAYDTARGVECYERMKAANGGSPRSARGFGQIFCVAVPYDDLD